MQRNLNSPATLAECADEHKRGVSAGNAEGLAIYLSVMRDKFGKGTKTLFTIWKRTEHECTAISFDGSLIAQYERELREMCKQDICPAMADIAHAYKPPRKPIKYKDARRCYRQGREAGWQFATLVFLKAIHYTEGYGGVRLMRVYEEACDLRDSVRRGYVKIADLEQALLDEAGIKIE